MINKYDFGQIQLNIQLNLKFLISNKNGPNIVMVHLSSTRCSHFQTHRLMENVVACEESKPDGPNILGPNWVDQGV